MPKLHTKQWFLNRIGKRIYRDDAGCPCFHCKEVFEQGLVIRDDQHADYLFYTEHDYARENVFLNYRDKK